MPASGMAFLVRAGMDTEREAVRTFRMDRISKARRLKQRFQLRPASMFWDACSDVGAVL